MDALQSCLNRMLSNISTNQLFPSMVNLYFKSCLEKCACGTTLKIYKTQNRKKATLALGEFMAHITNTHCDSCDNIYGGEELTSIIPVGSRFGYDVIEFVGTALFIDNRSDEEVRALLKAKNISISLREISYLGKKFIAYLALAHKESQNKIKNHMNSKGGYILHLDGTCEGDSPHLLSSIDGISRIVLDNIKIPSENIKYIKPYLEEIKKVYGSPTAIVHDMSASISNAVKEVFPGVKDFVCHLHFVRDIGKDLFSTEYSSIKRSLKSNKIRSCLRKFVRELKIFIENDSKLSSCLNDCLKKNYFENPATLPPEVSCYLLTSWVLESKNKSHGQGFPFDRPHVDFCDRLLEAYPILKDLKKQMPSNAPKLSLKKIKTTLNDSSLVNSLSLIKQKISIFDELRDAMRIVLPDSESGLNDNGEQVEMNTIEARVKKFREKIISLAQYDIKYKKMLKQIDKYWEKLFAGPIHIKTDTGEIITIQPQRTNNLMEQFFRSIKSSGRKKSGTSSLSKQLKSMLANTPLIKNLKLPEYVEMILNGKKSLAERFADINIKLVRDELKRESDGARKYPKGMTRIFRLADLPNKITQIVQKVA